MRRGVATRLFSRRLPGMTECADLQMGFWVVMPKQESSSAEMVRRQPFTGAAS